MFKFQPANNEFPGWYANNHHVSYLAAASVPVLGGCDERAGSPQYVIVHGENAQIP